MRRAVVFVPILILASSMHVLDPEAGFIQSIGDRKRMGRQVFRTAEEQYQVGKLEDAKRHCQVALALNPDNRDAIELLAETMILLGEGGEELYRKLQAAPADPLGNEFRKGLQWFVEGKLDRAEWSFEWASQYSHWVIPSNERTREIRAKSLEMIERIKIARLVTTRHIVPRPRGARRRFLEALR